MSAEEYESAVQPFFGPVGILQIASGPRTQPQEHAKGRLQGEITELHTLNC